MPVVRRKWEIGVSRLDVIKRLRAFDVRIDMGG